MQKIKTDQNTSKSVEAELQAHCQLSLSESTEKGKVEKVQEEVNEVQKMDECNYDEIKVIQENIVTINEKLETRF